MAACIEGMEAWEDLGSPRLVVAPMVDASELAWRILSRRHQAQLCYTPMLHSAVFVRDPRYRADALASCNEDRPLGVQFCGNDAETLVQAAILAQDHADLIDINLGCPQAIAKRGRYGAFLQDEWALLTQIVSRLRDVLRVPVSCKIRIYEDVDKTVEYAKMLERAGARILTVHGRTKEQKGRYTGLASWSHIQAVKAAVRIPVLANGNVQSIQDVERCLEETGCNGVMTAEGNLYNPCIFEGRYPPSWEMAIEYLDLVEKYPCPISYIRGHIFKLFHHVLSLPDNAELRATLAARGDLSNFRKVVLSLRDKYHAFHEGSAPWMDGYSDSYDLNLPPWLCRPYERPPPDLEADQETEEGVVAKRPRSDRRPGVSKRELKKIKKSLQREDTGRRAVDICTVTGCPNPAGLKCDSGLCKVCCKRKCFEEDLDCVGHGILIRSRRRKARMFEQENPKPITDVFT